MENITYPVIYGVDGEEHYVSFSNDYLTDVSSDTFEELVKEASEVLGLYAVDLHDNKEELRIPKAEDLILEKNEKILFLNIWLPYYIAMTKEEYKKKTLTIPTWLDLLAKNKNINFSQVLVNGLKKELGIE